jgi:hypothetical protein
MSTISVVAGIVRTLFSTAAGALLGGLAGPVGLAVGAGIGLVLGLVHGICTARVASYPSTGRGWWLLAVDQTWSLLNTIAGSLYLALNLLFGNRLDHAQSAGRTSIVLQHGVFSGFATTIGNVEAGTSPGIASHEYTHVFQARLFGPLYLVLVVANYVIATILPYWLIYHDNVGHKIDSFGDYFIKGVYPHVWNEAWAYRIGGSAP